MSEEKKYSVELDSVFVEKFYGLIDQPVPEKVDLDGLKNALEQIKTKMNNMLLGAQTSSPIISPASTIKSDYLKGGESEKVIRPKTILVVDDLGIITYQLDLMFKKMGFQVVVSHEINDAIEKFKTQDFGYTVMDLFIPTEREGFILLDEIKKLSLLCKLNTKIIVMTASSKREYRTNCKNHGADHFIEKTAGWQKELMKVVAAD